jgi:hypothetical protein
MRLSSAWSARHLRQDNCKSGYCGHSRYILQTMVAGTKCTVAHTTGYADDLGITAE